MKGAIATAEELIKKSSLLNYKSAAILAIIVVVIIIFISIIPYKKKATANVPIGTTVIIVDIRDKSPFIALTEEAYQTIQGAENSGNNNEIDYLTALGDIFEIESGTKAVVKDIGPERYFIEIQSGENEGKSGWIYCGFIEVKK